MPSLRSEWGIGSTAAVWLTAIGADRVRRRGGHLGRCSTSPTAPNRSTCSPQALCAPQRARRHSPSSSHSLSAAIPLRFLTGMFLAGVYPVGMKLMASWSESTDRGRSFGVLLGALTLGSALPHLISGLGPLPWRTVMLAAAALTAAAAPSSPSHSIRPGPHLDIRAITPNPRYAIAMFAERGPRLTSLGYFGHMWELYALWTWLSMFVVAGRGSNEATRPRRRPASSRSSRSGSPGLVGCLLGGWASDRFGRPPAAVAALVISGACCVASPIFFAAPTVVLVVFLLVWGAAVIADSGVFSTSLSETTDTRFVGTALTAQTAIGFLLTVVTIQLVPVVADLIGWRYAFLLLAPGPLIGAVAMSALLLVNTTNTPRRKAMTSSPTRTTPFVGQTARALTHRR